MRYDSFFWYDLETFGIDPFHDRIAQFAGIRTDMNLNPIEDPVVLYCRLSADYIPDPMACLVTGITPQEVKEKGIPESEFIQKINDIFRKPGTCVAGFNSIRFDDEFIRNALYRNFLDPYEREWKDGCTRWDIIDLVRAAHDLRPQGILWPPAKENGNPSFKLTELTQANSIPQIGAHDAMVDVYATIQVARLIKEKQPKLFAHYMTLRDKKVVKQLLNPQGNMSSDGKPVPVLHTNVAFTSPKGCTRMIVPITPHVRNENTIICFDLSQDLTPLLSAKPEDVFRVPGVIRIATNKVPFVAPVSTLRDFDRDRIGINYRECMIRYSQVIENLNRLIIKIRANDSDEYPQSSDPDQMIYSAFFSDYDKSLFKVIRDTPPQQRLSLNLSFRDSRCSQMLWRHVCRNYPMALDDQTMAQWKSFAATRLLSPPGNPINDINFVGRKIQEHLEDNSLTPKQKETLVQLRDYLISLKRFVGL